MQTDRDQLAADCVFCRIIARKVAAAEVYRDELVTAFLDHQPQTTIGELEANARLIRQALVEIDDGRS